MNANNNPGVNYQPFYRYNPQAGNNLNVKQRNNWRPRDHFFTFLTESISNRETYKSFIDSLKILNTAYQDLVLPKNKETM